MTFTTTMRDLFDLSRTGLSRLALGSVAESVVRRAPCPVLVVRLHPQG